MDWQTYIAAGIVVLTLTVFLVRLARPKTQERLRPRLRLREKPQ